MIIAPSPFLTIFTLLLYYTIFTISIFQPLSITVFARLSLSNMMMCLWGHSDYELGITRIPVDSLIILARYYNVSMDYICGLSNEK